jgi:serine/threonine-protein kinase
MPELPTTFGKYYLTEKLATGGMAEIYLAKLIGPGGFEKQLVIKQIHPKLTGQQPFVDLFVAEAKTLVTLAHGNIVPVYELGVVDDMYFIAMEYVDGPTLYRLTERMAAASAKMEPEVAAWIVARILEGLDYAHRKGEGVIHRDLSPRNVMLSRDGEVKLVDFGIAVQLGDPGDAGARESAPTGSFPYMSPEQVRRERLTGQTDLFSAGVLLWEMLVGERLFARPDPDSTLDAVLKEEIPRPSSRRDGVPERLDEVVMRALERDVGERWASAGEMLAALQKFLYSLEHTPGPQEVAALVARYSPPETRRMPTHAEPAPPEVPAGPSTKIVPRGKAKRAQTFATHVELEHMLEKASDSEPPAASPLETKPIPRRSAERAAVVDDRADENERAAEAAEDRRGMIAPKLSLSSRGLLISAGLVATAFAVAIVLIVYRGRERFIAADAAVAPPPQADARVDAPAVIDAAPDAPVPPDAPIDAPPERPHTDAIPLARPIDGGHAIDAAVDAAVGTATLRLGADPWGEIAIDGVAQGTTPKQLTVPAGHHTVEITYPAVTPPRKQTFGVDLAPGETKQLLADFK